MKILILLLFPVLLFAQTPTKSNLYLPSGGADSLGIVLPDYYIPFGKNSKIVDTSILFLFDKNTATLSIDADIYANGLPFVDSRPDTVISIVDGQLIKVPVDSVGGSGGDGLGTAFTANRILLADGTTAGTTDPNFRWNGTQLIIGSSTPTVAAFTMAYSAAGTTYFNFYNDNFASQETYFKIGNVTNAYDLGTTAAGDFFIRDGANSRFSISTAGKLKANAYTGTTFDDTPSKYLGLNSSQEVITFSAPAGADSLGLVMPTGYLLMGRGDALPDTSASLFWDTSNKYLKIGAGTAGFPTLSGVYISRAGTLVNQIESTDGGAVQIRLKSNNTNRRIIAEDNSANQKSQMELNDDSYRFYGATAGTNPLNIFVSGTYANRIGIGTATPAGAVDITSTTGGFLPPRMTSTQRDALTAVAGMVIYNTTTSKLQVYTTSWTDLH